MPACISEGDADVGNGGLSSLQPYSARTPAREIPAKRRVSIPTGIEDPLHTEWTVPDDVVRTVTQSAATVKLDQHGFEDS